LHFIAANALGVSVFPVFYKAYLPRRPEDGISILRGWPGIKHQTHNRAAIQTNFSYGSQSGYCFIELNKISIDFHPSSYISRFILKNI